MMYRFMVVFDLQPGRRVHSARHAYAFGLSPAGARIALDKHLAENNLKPAFVGELREWGDVSMSDFFTVPPDQLARLRGEVRQVRLKSKEPELSDRPLGELQFKVLRSLREHHGYWFENCGWLWDTPSGTRRILESLHARGLVKREGSDSSATYSINADGDAALEKNFARHAR